MDTRPPRVRARVRQAERDRARRAGPAPEVTHPLPRAAQQGARVPRLPHRRRRRRAWCAASAARAAAACGTGAAGARAAGRRPTATTRSRCRCATRPATSTVAPAPIPRGRAGAARNRGVGAPLHAAGPLSVVPAGSVATLEVGPDRPRVRVRPVAPRRPARRSQRGKRVGGALPGADPAKRQDRRLRRARARRPPAAPSGRSRSPGLPQSKRAGASAPRPLVVLPAITWQGLNDVDDDFDGFADSLPKSRSVGLDRPFAGGGLPPRLRLRGGAAAALPRPRAASLRPDHRPLAGARRGPGARQRAGRGVRGQRPVGSPSRCCAGCATRWPTACASPPSAPTRFRRTVRLRDDRLVDPRRQRANAFGETHGAAAQPERAADRVRGRARAVRGARLVLRRLHATSSSRSGCRPGRARSPPPAATRGSPRSWPSGWAAAS